MYLNARARSPQPGGRVAAWRLIFAPAQFRDRDFPDLLADILRRSGLPAALLELEVTEGVLIHDEEQTLATLRALKVRGVRIVLDDFGSGYSSLSYLRRFPFDKIKIDKSFVHAQEHDAGAQAIVETIVAMTSRLNLEVTAEGVETAEQLAMIRRQGCTEVQGNLLAHPMAANEVTMFLDKRRGVEIHW